MTRTRNELLENRKKNLYADKDLKFNYSTDSARKNTGDPYHYVRMNSSTCSFVADWQLPKSNIHSADNPVC
jgi:hypothetical protein